MLPGDERIIDLKRKLDSYGRKKIKTYLRSDSKRLNVFK